MTDHNNTNGSEEEPGAKAPSGAPSDVPAHDQPMGGESWEDFLAAHADDLEDVEHSRTAKRFSKHAEREEKKALLSVTDLKKNAFVSGDRYAQPGPRDHTGTSWLDTDDVMDRYGDDFVPPNPQLGTPSPGRAVLWALFILGALGLIATCLFPAVAAILGVVFGLMLLIGAGGLLATHRGHDESKDGFDDDGARV